MEKGLEKVFMSCVVDDMYLELKLKEGVKEALSSCLKTVQSGNRVDSKALKQRKLLRSLIKGEYLALKEFYDDTDEKENAYLKEILSKLSIERFFQMQMSRIPELFYCLGKYAKRGDSKGYKLQEEMFRKGLENTKYLEKMGIKLLGDRFVSIENNKTEVIDKPVVYVKTSKKIS